MSSEPDMQLAAEAAYAQGPPQSVRLLLWRRFLRHRLALASLLVLALLANLLADLCYAWLDPRVSYK